MLNGSLNVTSSTFSGNSGAGSGAAILLAKGTTNITDSTFYDNVATNGHGAAVASGYWVVLNVYNSTFFNNTASNAGGAMSLGGTATITNSSIVGNTAGWGWGSGINLWCYIPHLAKQHHCQQQNHQLLHQ